MVIHSPPIPRSRVLAAIAALQLGDFGDPTRITALGLTRDTIRIDYLDDDGRPVTIAGTIEPDTIRRPPLLVCRRCNGYGLTIAKVEFDEPRRRCPDCTPDAHSETWQPTTHAPAEPGPTSSNSAKPATPGPATSAANPSPADSHPTSHSATKPTT